MTRLRPFAPVLATVLSGLAIYFSMGLGGDLTPQPGWSWALALVAMVPVLWTAFTLQRDWTAGLAVFAAGAIGGLNILPAYGTMLPLPILVLAIATPALTATLAALAARIVMRRVTPASAVFMFAFAWTGFDYLLSFGPNGTVSSPAYAQAAMPWMIQSASLGGLWVITFVAGFFAAALALAAATRQWALAGLAAGILVLNLGFGAWRLNDVPQTPTTRIGLAADDTLIPLRFKGDDTTALKVIAAYADAARKLTAQKAELIVFPERVAVVKPEWRGLVNQTFQAVAKTGHASIVIGIDAREAERHNAALFYYANGAAPLSYAKRHLLGGLEDIFTPGTGSLMVVNDRSGVAICKDMDFPATLRADAVYQPTLYAVPAWDFDKDGAWHAKAAILRGVENGFAVARAANNGLLTVSDAYGRVVAAKATQMGGMVTLVADVARGPGRTQYAETGDGWAWISIAMSLILLAVALVTGRSKKPV